VEFLSPLRFNFYSPTRKVWERGRRRREIDNLLVACLVAAAHRIHKDRAGVFLKEIRSNDNKSRKTTPQSEPLTVKRLFLNMIVFTPVVEVLLLNVVREFKMGLI
jgi:hypothetical protein